MPGKAPHAPSITRLGVTCFRLSAIDGAAIRLAGLTPAMAAFAPPRETRRARFQRQVTAMDRVIREALAPRSAIAS